MSRGRATSTYSRAKCVEMTDHQAAAVRRTCISQTFNGAPAQPTPIDNRERDSSASNLQLLSTGFAVAAAARWPLACAVAVVLWGPDASSDKQRAGARCTSCGGKGATLQRLWGGRQSYRLSLRAPLPPTLANARDEIIGLTDRTIQLTCRSRRTQYPENR